MIEAITSTVRKARKKHRDDAYEWISEWISENGYSMTPMSFADYRILVRVKNEREWARYIQPGQMYTDSVNKFDGEIYSFRSKIEFQPLFRHGYGIFDADF